MEIKIKDGNDAARFFRKLAAQEYDKPTSMSDVTFAVPPAPSRKVPLGAGLVVPNIKELRLVRSLVDVNAELGKNLNYMASADDWRDFYCFPTASDVEQFKQAFDVPSNLIINRNQETSENFVQTVISHSEKAKENNETQFIFLSGTTGVGKTTFVKFHARTQKMQYLKKRKIISRLKFSELEDRILKSKDSGETNGNLSILERHLINCLFRDVVESLNMSINAHVFEQMNGIKEDLEDVIAEVEAKIELALKHSSDATLSDAVLFDRITDLDEGDIEALSLTRKIEALKQVSKKFQFVVFLDGFDAIEPEAIVLSDQRKTRTKRSKHEVFLECLESIAVGSFSGGGEISAFLKSAPLVFCISARPITIAQLKLSVQSDVRFDQVFGTEAFIVGSPVFSIVRERMKVRGKLQGRTLRDKDIDVLIAAIELCLHALRQDFGLSPGFKLVSLFNHNIRDKLNFLRDVSDFFLRKMAASLYANPSLMRHLMRVGHVEFIHEVSLRELDIDSYEFEKILVLDPFEKFSNNFEYNRHDELVQASGRGAFDNILNYRISVCERSVRNFKYCPLLAKYLIMKRVQEERSVFKCDLDAWLHDLGYDWEAVDLDQKILIRAGMLVGEFDPASKELVFSSTPKGRFLLERLLYKYTYFERACTQSRLPNFIRKRWQKVEQTSGAVWGRASIVNVALVISYIRYVEKSMDLEQKYRLSESLSEKFAKVVEKVATQGMSNDYNNYAASLEQSFSRAFM